MPLVNAIFLTVNVPSYPAPAANGHLSPFLGRDESGAQATSAKQEPPFPPTSLHLNRPSASVQRRQATKFRYRRISTTSEPRSAERNRRILVSPAVANRAGGGRVRGRFAPTDRRGPLAKSRLPSTLLRAQSLPPVRN